MGQLLKHLEEFCFQRLGLFKMENSYDLSLTSLTFRDFPSIEWALTTAFNFYFIVCSHTLQL